MPERDDAGRGGAGHLGEDPCEATCKGRPKLTSTAASCYARSVAAWEIPMSASLTSARCPRDQNLHKGCPRAIKHNRLRDAESPTAWGVPMSASFTASRRPANGMRKGRPTLANTAATAMRGRQLK